MRALLFGDVTVRFPPYISVCHDVPKVSVMAIFGCFGSGFCRRHVSCPVVRLMRHSSPWIVSASRSGPRRFSLITFSMSDTLRRTPSVVL